MPEILTERRGHLGLITLNRPKALNALNAGMCREFLDVLLEWRDDHGIAQVAVMGAGERGLCAGGDIVAIYRDILDRSGESADFWRIEYQLNVLISEYPKPYIAFMDGIVLGGGIGISAHGSHRIVTEASRCGMPEVGIGFFPDVGGTHLLARAPYAAGRMAALTGIKVGPADTVALGLADSYVPRDQFPALLAELETRTIAEALDHYAGIPEPGFLQDEWVQAFEEPHIPAVLRALEQSGSAQAQDALQALNAACPSSVRLVEELMSLAGADLRVDLQREYRAAVHRLDDPDFAEGIRAAVIDKDRNPQWVETIPGLGHEQRTQRHFAPLPGSELTFALLGKDLQEESRT